MVCDPNLSLNRKKNRLRNVRTCRNLDAKSDCSQDAFDDKRNTKVTNNAKNLTSLLRTEARRVVLARAGQLEEKFCNCDFGVAIPKAGEASD